MRLRRISNLLNEHFNRLQRQTANEFYTATNNLIGMTKTKIVMALQLYVKDAEYNEEMSYAEVRYNIFPVQ